MNTEIKRVRTAKTEMKYFSFGDPKKQPVVVLPGLSIKSVMESADAIVSAYERLSRDFHLYVLDRSADVTEGCTVSDLSEDSYEALREIGLDNAFLYGVSQGGMMAQIMALRHPEFVRAMALCSTTARVDNGKAIEQWAALAERKDRVGLVSSFAESVYSPAFLSKYRSAIMAMADDISDEELERFVIMAKASEGFDVYEELAEIKCPVIVLGASNDMVLGPEASVRLAERVKGELFVYEDYGHAVYDEAPDFLDRVYDFYMKVNK